MVDIIRAGLAPTLVPYSDGWELQRRVHRSVADGTSPDTLIHLEHEPVFTAGTRTTLAERPTDGTPVIDVDRGGKLTWHGPGQLTGYPILRLPQPLDGVAYVRRLEAVLIQVLGDVGVEGRSIRGRTGVWVDTLGGIAKIAAIGVRVAEGVSMHGYALNCSNSLEPYAQFVPCGIRDAGIASITTVIGRTVTPADIVDDIEAAFTAELTVAA